MKGGRGPVNSPELAALQHPAHRWGFGAFLLAEVVLLLSAVFLTALFERFPSSARISAVAVVVGTIVPTLLATAVAIIATKVRGNGLVIDFRLKPHWDDIKFGLKYGFAGLLLTTVAAVFWAKAVGQQNASSTLASVIDNHPLPVDLGIVMFLYAWLIGPLCEEMIFRGLLWDSIERMQWGRWSKGVAFLLSSVIFAIGHLEPVRTSLLLVISIPIGYCRLVTGRLPASVIAHQINNFVPALSILLMSFGTWT